MDHTFLRNMEHRGVILLFATTSAFHRLYHEDRYHSEGQQLLPNLLSAIPYTNNLVE